MDPRPDPLGRQLEHQKPLAVARDVVAPRPGPPGAVGIRPAEQGPGRAAPAIVQVDAHRHHAVTLPVDQLPPVPGPQRLRSVRRRDLPSLQVRVGERLDVPFEPTRPVGVVGHSAPKSLPPSAVTLVPPERPIWNIQMSPKEFGERMSTAIRLPSGERRGWLYRSVMGRARDSLPRRSTSTTSVSVT